MRVEKKHFFDSSEINSFKNSSIGEKADLVFYFGGRELIDNGSIHESIKKLYPNSIVLGCSTGGEIAHDEIYEDSIVTLAIDFEKTQIKQTSSRIHKPEDSFAAGQKIAADLNAKDLRGIFILSDGLCVNGSSLVNGISSSIGKSIPIMGGLAGDGKNFTKTLVGGMKKPDERVVEAVGFYGDAIQFGHGSSGGWDIFGPERKITKSQGNILYEVDGKPFLDVYKSYLGKLSENLPWSALLFPLTIWPDGNKKSSVVRTVLSLDENEKSMTFAGDVPEGYTAQLMRGFIPRLVEGASQAGEMASNGISGIGDSVAILISCIGRKLVLSQRSNEEVERVRRALNDENCYIAGFYSYGEICPHLETGYAELHNQTMTVTTFSER